MEFNWINLINACFLAAILLPNMIYAAKGGTDPKAPNRFVEILEQVGRYASMGLMVLPLLVWEFGFSSVTAMLIWMLGCIGLILAYWVFWIFFFRKVTLTGAMALAILPACVFALCGICLRHWLLLFSAVVFAVGHISITYATHKK